MVSVAWRTSRPHVAVMVARTGFSGRRSVVATVNAAEVLPSGTVRAGGVPSAVDVQAQRQPSGVAELHLLLERVGAILVDTRIWASTERRVGSMS